VRFFALTYVLTWLPWFAAAYFSFQSGMDAYRNAFFFLGGFGPAATALFMVFTSGSPELKRDFVDRLMNLRRSRWPYLAASILLFPFLSFASVFVSLWFGGSAHQLTVVSNLVAWLPLMFLAPVCEELGWRGYGVDALRSRLGMLATALAFGVLWGLWHAPLLFINHTYQHEVWLTHPVYVLNFFVGIIPTAVIFNWLYYRADRLIPALIALHFSANVIPESFNIVQSTKLMSLPIHIVLAVVIVAADWKLFRQGPKTFLVEAADAR
jgi:membrane protease YdiL (CAAX protease family)